MTIDERAAFEELEHTADVGLRIRGRTFAELCANAALGTYSLIGVASFPPGERRSRVIEVGCASPEEGLYDWLRAIVVAFAIDAFFAVEARVEVAEGRIRGVLKGGSFDVAEHEFFTEIKAVTRHGLVVRRGRDGFEAEVIFDV